MPVRVRPWFPLQGGTDETVPKRKDEPCRRVVVVKTHGFVRGERRSRERARAIDLCGFVVFYFRGGALDEGLTNYPSLSFAHQ